MSRSKTLWEAECDQICWDFQDGKLTFEAAVERLHDKGWERDDAAMELEAWTDIPAPPTKEGGKP